MRSDPPLEPQPGDPDTAESGDLCLDVDGHLHVVPTVDDEVAVQGAAAPAAAAPAVEAAEAAPAAAVVASPWHRDLRELPKVRGKKSGLCIKGTNVLLNKDVGVWDLDNYDNPGMGHLMDYHVDKFGNVQLVISWLVRPAETDRGQLAADFENEVWAPVRPWITKDMNSDCFAGEFSLHACMRHPCMHMFPARFL